jgi:hypothetical protein
MHVWGVVNLPATSFNRTGDTGFVDSSNCEQTDNADVPCTMPFDATGSEDTGIV